MGQDPTNGVTRGAAGAALALHRFGLGPRPGSIAAIASDPRGAVLAELERPGVGRVDDRGLMSSAASARAAFEARAARQAQRIVTERAKREAEAQSADGAGTDMARTAAVAAGAEGVAPPTEPGDTPERRRRGGSREGCPRSIRAAGTRRAPHHRLRRDPGNRSLPAGRTGSSTPPRARVPRRRRRVCAAGTTTIVPVR